MSKNSFKELEENKLAEIGEPPASIKKEIDGELNFFKFVGDIIELYLSKLLGALTNLTDFQGDNKDSSPKEDGNNTNNNPI